MNDLDEYQVKSIAEREARAVVDELRRELDYGDLANLRDAVASIESAMRIHGDEQRSMFSEVWDAIGDLRTRPGG